VPAVAAVGYAALTEVPRGGGRRADVRFVLVDVDFELVRLEQDAVGVDALEVESDFLRLDAEFGQDVREVVVDDLALFEDLRVLGDHDRAVLDTRGGPDSLELADERSRIDARVTLGDDDVVGGDLARVDRGGGLRGFQLLEEAERVVVRADERDLTRDVLGQLFDAVVYLFERTDGERVAAHPDVRGAVQLAAHGLKLAARDAGDADDPDGVERPDKVDELVDLLLFPLRDRLGLADRAHTGTSLAGPIVVFT